MDDMTHKYLGFEMKKGEVERKEMMKRLEERIDEKLKEPTQRVEVFEARNRIHAMKTKTLRAWSGSTVDPLSSPSGGLTESTE